MYIIYSHIKLDLFVIVLRKWPVAWLHFSLVDYTLYRIHYTVLIHLYIVCIGCRHHCRSLANRVVSSRFSFGASLWRPVAPLYGIASRRRCANTSSLQRAGCGMKNGRNQMSPPPPFRWVVPLTMRRWAQTSASYEAYERLFEPQTGVATSVCFSDSGHGFCFRHRP